MNMRFLIFLSHLVTLMFGVALGMSLCLLYQYMVKIFIFDLSATILLIVFVSTLLRVYTVIVWNKKKYILNQDTK